MTTEELITQQSMEKMGVDNYLRTYRPKTNKHKAIVYQVALKLKDRQIHDLKQKINQMHDQIDELKDGILR